MSRERIPDCFRRSNPPLEGMERYLFEADIEGRPYCFLGDYFRALELARHCTENEYDRICNPRVPTLKDINGRLNPGRRQPEEAAMKPQTQVRQDRLYLHWTDRCSYTTSYPIERGADGRRYAVFPDTDEMTEIREALGIDEGREHVFGQTWDPRALALEDIDIDVEMD